MYDFRLATNWLAREIQGVINHIAPYGAFVTHRPYWQAKEISRVIQECDPSNAQIDISLLKHISPIGWENVILYGEYVLNRNLIQP